MEISATKRKYLLGQTLFTLLAGVIIGLGLDNFFPGHYFSFYPVIPLYFYFFGCLYIYIYDEFKKHNPNKLHMVFMGMKVGKMLISIFVILIYALFDKEHKLDFILTFLLFYVLSLIYETCFFFAFEKRLKLKKEDKK